MGELFSLEESVDVATEREETERLYDTYSRLNLFIYLFFFIFFYFFWDKTNLLAINFYHLQKRD